MTKKSKSTPKTGIPDRKTYVIQCAPDGFDRPGLLGARLDLQVNPEDRVTFVGGLIEAQTVRVSREEGGCPDCSLFGKGDICVPGEINLSGAVFTVSKGASKTYWLRLITHSKGGNPEAEGMNGTITVNPGQDPDRER
ncbi:MAG: hypothetical protein EOO71_22755 [Myxococcaceae bacterium]|nr:MAG: hypothetical protein EOO71_22755 [Myxococcaceae bacterium]